MKLSPLEFQPTMLWSFVSSSMLQSRSVDKNELDPPPVLTLENRKAEGEGRTHAYSLRTNSDGPETATFPDPPPFVPLPVEGLSPSLSKSTRASL